MKPPIVTDTYIPKLSRRALLKGAGATLALPFLQSLSWASGGSATSTASAAVAATTPSGAPRRWATLMFANGVNTKHWWARGEGARMALSSSLKALEPYRQELLFLNNLHIFDDTVGVHTPYFTNFLAGEKVRHGNIPDLAESVDQFMARYVGTQTPVPVLNLGVEPASYGLGGGGKPAIYNSTISWSSRTTPVPPEIYPRQAFDRLFDVSGLQRERSILDTVLGQAKSLQGQLDSRDRDKLDQYMTSVREIEQRIDKATSDDRFAGGWSPTIDEPSLERPPEGLPGDRIAHMKLMVDLIVLAFQMDQTRIATMLFQKDLTGMRFDFLDQVSANGMHTISHHNSRASALEDYRKINEYHVGLLRYMLDRMQAIDEGDGNTLLDNTMLMFCSSMGDGDLHDANHLPILLVGGRNCDLQPGRIVDYTKLEDRRLCNLHLALAQRMGVPVDQFGNSHYPLPGLTA